VSRPAEPPRVRAAGCAVWRPADGGGLETALVHRPKYDDWSLPKGKPEAGEHPLGRRSVRTSYDVPLPDGGLAPKDVDYWTAQWTGGEFRANDEVDELRWLPVADAADLCTHAHDRAVLADLARTDVPLMPTVVLVRHGRAGDRSDWDGPDELRPLDGKGRRQAQRLAEVLPLLRPSAVYSAPRTRCEQTVAPLANSLSLPVLPLPELAEEEFQAAPEAGLATIERLLARTTPGVTVVCSQGGAIPSVLMALGVRVHGQPVFPPSAKGSAWVLGGAPGGLSADYYRDF
jgi:8-oxo-(d)GTP phosphatase